MVTRRTLLTTVPALAASLGVVAPAAAAPGRLGAPAPTAYVGGRVVPRAAVRQWEARRVRVAAQRLSNHLPTALLADLDALLRRPARDTSTLDRDRELLAAVKLEMGAARLRRLLAPDLALSTPAGRVAARLGTWAVSRAAVVAPWGSAQGFADWFTARGTVGDERALLVACPDHYLIRDLRPGLQEVVEVTGGAVLAARFVIDYADHAGLPVAEDPLLPVRLAGWARAEGGDRIGGVRHQLRDEPGGGFRAELAVAFPAALPRWMITEHRWHLACEFSGWATAYGATLGGGAVGGTP
ncbi:hypothetical protein [Pimelobacter simplex]|uniref:hypothetical protein n=1 Tax=Nocardioides simplex TaxID=2045 RepID=UPI00214FC2E9|nr:hypothetical protein [Pimelobacter simplex]UUW92426.1 hypothetical protein M0M43_13355 [Pimelobacter simplex]UUW96254.1 hypothetical protein M0M48_01990 [Pimelobacter simplex]